MAAMRGGPRLAVGSAAWIAEERSSARQVVAHEVDEFSFSVRNEMEWLNEHMADIFSENQMNVAELFKTPGKLRGKTPRTGKKTNPGETRVPLSNIFSATPKGAPNPFVNSTPSQAQQSRIKIAEDAPSVAPQNPASPSKTVLPPLQQQQQSTVPVSVVDSGYHGSQSQETVDVDMVPVDEPFTRPETAMDIVAVADFASSPTRTTAAPFVQASPTRVSIEETFESAKEDQTRWMTANMTARVEPQLPETNKPEEDKPQQTQDAQRSPTRKPVQSSPVKSYTPKTSPVKASPAKAPPHTAAPQQAALQSEEVDATADDIRSPSDGSSPIRPIVRKSSLNFASLPAREPLTSNKSLGPRVSRISHLDHTRTSYYHRQTSGKSLGANAGMEVDDDNDDNEGDNENMDIDDDQVMRKEQVDAKVAIAAHNKTYTQRLQDQISMLGKSQPSGPRPSKSLANLVPAQQPSVPQQPQQTQQSQPAPEAKAHSPIRQKLSVPAPGAFPEDDDDDWIVPPPAAQPADRLANPRPEMTKSYSTDVMDGLHGKDTIGGSAFVLPKSRPMSPRKAPTVPERTTSAIGGHSKSASVPSLPIMENAATPKKTISVSNPTLNPVDECAVLDSPPKSPSRTLRESPLKHVKNKLSSILKSSKGLLASSAALSAEGKASLMSPSTTRLGIHPGPSTDSLRSLKPSESLYPELPERTATPPVVASPVRNTSRRTRASVEREKKEAKEKEKERKEVQRIAEQMDKLEKEREKEREKARIFNKERERIAAMEKQINEAKEHHRAPQAEVATPAPPKSPVKATRTSPRKTKAQKEAEEKAAAAAAAEEARAAGDDTDMVDATSIMPPPSIPRPTTTPSAARSQTLRRPTRPTQEVPSKAKAAPTLIRVKPTSAQQAQFHPSNSVLGSTLQDTLGPQQQEPRRQLTSKPSHTSLHTKPSLQSLKSSVGSSGRPKALELAAKRKEQEEREAQRKKEAKQEIERKRAAMQEEERRKEQLRQLEMERQLQEERKIAEKAAQAKKDAQRQAAIERAKQTRAPPPAPRSQPNGDYNMADKAPSRPPSRLGSMIPQDSGRPVNASLHASKMAPKRTLQPESGEDARPPMQRNGPSYQAKEAKRMRMSEEFDEDIDMADSQRSVIRGPPVRPSGGFKKVGTLTSHPNATLQAPNQQQELPPKSQFNNGYTSAPQGVSRDLFKTMVTSQHTVQAKAAHPLDTAQFSKGAIPFAPNPNPAGPSAAHKTPARQLGAASGKSAAKSAAPRSSPFGKQGDNISLPDIQTDDEDEDSDDDDGGRAAGKLQLASWTNSPDLRKLLVGQETIDPMQIFGPPAPINMEEIFSKNKERMHKFRARTSSANWSGSDRLTEEDIRKDLQARDRMRRDGGWSYELARDGLA